MPRPTRLFLFLSRAISTLALALFTLHANAGLVRYDVSYTGSSQVPAFDGYMLFNDTTPVAGDIWGGVVDWYFDAGGSIIDPGNTVAASTGFFEVDAAWNFVSDFDIVPGPPAAGHAPCFSNVILCDSSGNTQLGFTNALVFSSVILLHPDLPGFNIDFGGSVEYSGPHFIPVPASGGLLLMATGLLWLRRRNTP